MGHLPLYVSSEVSRMVRELKELKEQIVGSKIKLSPMMDKLLREWLPVEIAKTRQELSRVKELREERRSER